MIRKLHSTIENCLIVKNMTTSASHARGWLNRVTAELYLFHRRKEKRSIKPIKERKWSSQTNSGSRVDYARVRY